MDPATSYFKKYIPSGMSFDVRPGGSMVHGAPSWHRITPTAPGYGWDTQPVTPAKGHPPRCRSCSRRRRRANTLLGRAAGGAVPQIPT
ncbi:hypothetical protein N9L68_06415 [bacterium]|nr:hypothetical protein [bacterium]